MPSIIDIINEEIMTSVANFPGFGDRLNSISETGEGTSNTYPFKFDNVAFNEVNYHFDTEEDEYVVVVNLIDVHAGAWDMQFGTVGGTPDEIVDRGRMFNVMATLILIVNDFIDRYKPNIIRFKPSKAEDKKNANQRYQLYMAYIKKHQRPEYLTFPYGEHIIIKRKVPIESNVPKI